MPIFGRPLRIGRLSVDWSWTWYVDLVSTSHTLYLDLGPLALDWKRRR